MRIGRWHQLRKGLRLTMALAGALLCAPLLAQGTWTWQQQCSSNEWSAICYTYAGCGYDQNHNPVHRYFNNWGHSQCSVSPGLPGPGSIVIFPEGANARLASNVDIKSVLVSSGAVFDWYSGGLTLRDPANNNSPGTLTNQGLLRVVANSDDFRSLSGLLVNSGTLVHYNNRVWFDGATLQNTGTLELQAGELNDNSGTNLIQNTATLRKTTTNSFTIYVPLQTENATMEVQAGSLSLKGAGDYRTNTTWSVASGATLLLSGSTTYTFTGTHSGAIAGTLMQTAGTVAAGSGGAVFNFTGNGFAWYAGALNGGSDGLTNQGLLRVVANSDDFRSLSGLLVNSGTLVHYNNRVWFDGATLQNTGTLELQAGELNDNSGTNLIQNTATLRKTTTNSFTIYVPLQTENATMEVQAGSLSLKGAGDYRTNTTWSVASGATLLLSGSTTYITGTHSGAIAGTLMQTAGTVAAGSGGAVFNFTGNGFAWYAGALNGGSDGLTNQGLLRVVANSDDFRSLSGLLVNSGTLVHYKNRVWFNGATLQNTGTLELQAGELNDNSGTNLIQNTATLRKTTTNSFTIYVPLQTQNATMEVQAGSLSLTGAGDYRTNTTWSVASGATLYLSGSTTYTFTGTHSGAIAGTFIQTNGTVQAGSGGATFNFTGNGFAWYAGALNGGSDGLTNQGLLRVVANSGDFRSLSGLLVNSGTLVHYKHRVWFDGATLQNTGTLELQAGALNHNTGTNLIQNTGAIRKVSPDPNNPTSFTISVPLQTENATMEVQAGSLSLTGAGDYRTNTTWSVASGATLYLSGSTTYTFTGTHSGAIAGTFIQTNGTVQAGSGGATFNFTGNGFAWYAGALNGGSDGLTNQGLLRVVANSGDFRSLSGLLVNSGTLVHYKHRVWFDGATLQNTGTLELQAGALNHNTGTNLIQNTGAIRKVSPDPNNPTSFTISVPTTNSGRIEVLSGTLSITNLTQTDGETRIHRGTTLTSSNPVQLQGGKLTGAGTLNAALNNTAGTIAPGINDPDHPDLNPLGILTILGNLTLGADAVLEVELVGADNSDPANPQYDQLIVGQGGYTRTLQLGGILRVKGRDGYVPNPGDAFDIIVRAGSWNRSGSLARVEVDPDTLPCVVFEVQYLPDRVRLVASIPSVDTNRDGCVDDADLLAVLFAFGQTGNGLPEDVVCDGVVDDADLLAVLFAFGQGC